MRTRTNQGTNERTRTRVCIYARLVASRLCIPPCSRNTFLSLLYILGPPPIPRLFAFYLPFDVLSISFARDRKSTGYSRHCRHGPFSRLSARVRSFFLFLSPLSFLYPTRAATATRLSLQEGEKCLNFKVELFMKAISFYRRCGGLPPAPGFPPFAL